MSNKKKVTKKQKKKKLYWKITWLGILSLLLAMVIVFYVKYGRSIIRLREEAEAIVSESTVDTFKQNQTTLVYGSEGQIISKIKGEKDVYYLTYDEIPYYAKQAMVSIEDKSFSTHSGIDYKANIRAVLSLIKNKGEITQGASTITQQLSRNVFLTFEKTWERKIKEIFIAMELEKRYDKTQILEFYLNNIYFANGYYGIQAASKGYFNQSVDQLSLSQIAFLCAIPNNPTLYDPVDNLKNTIKRRDRILLQMYDDKKISKDEYDAAVAEQITLHQTTIEKQNYVDTFVLHCAVESLMKQEGFVFQNKFNSDEEKENYNTSYKEAYSDAKQDLYTKGYRIYTSIDESKQKELQQALDNQLKQFDEVSEDGTFTFQGASVCIDNKTGRVVAIVGGRSQDTKGYTLNRAYQSYRQPGSAIKPLIVYTPAFMKGYTPWQTVEDSKIEDGPSNSDGTYAGKLPLRRAVELSKNTVAYKIFEDITPKYGLSFLYDMNFKKLSKSDYYPTAGIGGFTYGTSPLEMAAGFATLENDGIYREPTCIIKITDAQGQEVISPEVVSEVVYDKNAARMMTDVLTGVMTDGTARRNALKGMVSAGKTGTTNRNKDGWFVGYTPYYTTSVWVGYDTPKTMNSLKGGSYPLYIWQEFMQKIHKGLKNVGFEPYEGKHTEPKETVEPTISPEATIEPTPTIEVEVTPTPENTEAPEGTQSPEPTKQPEVTKEPVVAPTKNPEPTEEPEESDEPEESEEPEDEESENEQNEE